MSWLTSERDRYSGAARVRKLRRFRPSSSSMISFFGAIHIWSKKVWLVFYYFSKMGQTRASVKKRLFYFSKRMIKREKFLIEWSWIKCKCSCSNKILLTQIVPRWSVDQTVFLFLFRYFNFWCTTCIYKETIVLFALLSVRSFRASNPAECHQRLTHLYKDFSVVRQTARSDRGEDTLCVHYRSLINVTHV